MLTSDSYHSTGSGSYSDPGHYPVVVSGWNGYHSGYGFGSVWVLRMNQVITDPCVADASELNPGLFLGKGNTATVKLRYLPTDLADAGGSEKLLALDSASWTVKVYDGSTLIIYGSDKEQVWSLAPTRQVTVEGYEPGIARLDLSYYRAPYTLGEADQINVTVVRVYQVHINASGWYDVTDDTITVLKGTKYTFRAKTDPLDTSWPAGWPVWTLNNNPVGLAGDPNVEITFDSAGTKTLKAKCGSADAGKTVTINVIVPQPDEISFVDNNAGEEHNIYEVTDPVWKRVENPDNPASYTKNKKMKVNAKFWAPANLTYPTQVKVDGSGFSEDTTVTFQSWPSETTVHVADSNLADSIGTWNVTITWTYKVIPQPNQEVTMSATSGPHKIQTVWDAPKCASNLYTKTNLDTCVTEWASDCIKVDTSNDSNNVPHQVQHGAKNWYATYGYAGNTDAVDDPFTWIPAHKGDCKTYADLMTKGLLLLGVDAQTEEIHCKVGLTRFWFYSNDRVPHWLTAGGDADGDGTTNANEAGYPGVLEGIYEYGNDPNHNASWRTANEPWNFHGACSCAGHWWEITFNTTPDHETEAEMCRHPNGPVILRRGPLYPNGSR